MTKRSQAFLQLQSITAAALAAACSSTTCPSAPVASSDQTAVTFVGASCKPVLSVPLNNGSTPQQTGQGSFTVTSHERAVISDDRKHAGISRITLQRDVSNDAGEATEDSEFRYYDSSGLRWQAQAPAGTTFYIPLVSADRIVAADGTRVLLIAAGPGLVDPVLTVYDDTGKSIYELRNTFADLDRGRISPDGRYLLAIGTAKAADTAADLIVAVDLHNGTLAQMNFDAVSDGRPTVTNAADGRFSVMVGGNQRVLP